MTSLRSVMIVEPVLAHSHPIGATGAALTTRLLHSMRRDGLKRGVVTWGRAGSHR